MSDSSKSDSRESDSNDSVSGGSGVSSPTGSSVPTTSDGSSVPTSIEKSSDTEINENFDKLSYMAIMKLDHFKLASYAYRLTKVVSHWKEAIDKIQSDIAPNLVNEDDADNLKNIIKEANQKVLQAKDKHFESLENKNSQAINLDEVSKVTDRLNIVDRKLVMAEDLIKTKDDKLTQCS